MRFLVAESTATCGNGPRPFSFSHALTESAFPVLLFTDFPTAFVGLLVFFVIASPISPTSGRPLPRKRHHLTSPCRSNSNHQPSHSTAGWRGTRPRAHHSTTDRWRISFPLFDRLQTWFYAPHEMNSCGAPNALGFPCCVATRILFPHTTKQVFQSPNKPKYCNKLILMLRHFVNPRNASYANTLPTALLAMIGRPCSLRP